MFQHYFMEKSILIFNSKTQIATYLLLSSPVDSNCDC